MAKKRKNFKEQIEKRQQNALLRKETYDKLPLQQKMNRAQGQKERAKLLKLWIAESEAKVA